MPLAWLWSKAKFGVHVVTVWQAAQLSVVRKWLPDFPVAGGWRLSWQETHVAVVWLWSNDAGNQAAVEWQLSQAFDVTMCVGVLPVAGRWAGALS